MRSASTILLAIVFMFGFISFAPLQASAGEAGDAPERTAVLTGRITDQDGAPVAGAVVEAYQYGYSEPRPMPADDGQAEGSGETEPAEPDKASMPYYEDGYQRAETDADGRYHLSLYPGYANLNVWKDGYASAWADIELSDGNQSQDLTLRKFPDKTAHIEGRVVDRATGNGLRWASVSIENPEFGVYECSVHDGDAVSGGGSPGSTGMGSAEAVAPSSPEGDAMIMPYPYDPGCTITVHDDGTFEGDVTPGYSILRVYYEHWRTCNESQDSDGGFQRSCGKDYFAHSQVLTLAGDETTELRIALVPRPSPDATVSGYVVDGETGQAIPGAQVSFSNQERQGWAWANTDGDGSYRVRLMSGYTQVHVWADGYFPWEGFIALASGDETPFDITLTAGQSTYGGGCCYALDARGAESAPVPASGAPGAADESGASQSSTDGDGETATQAFEDLGGGLGPYNAAERENVIAEGPQQATPWPGLAVLLIALAAAAWLVRRQG